MYMPACQKKAPDLITDGCEPLCGCWGLNSGPLKEQPVLLTSESSLQSQISFYNHFPSSLVIIGEELSFIITFTRQPWWHCTN